MLSTCNWLGGVVVRTLDLRPKNMEENSGGGVENCVAGSSPGHDTAWLFLR